MESIPRFRLIPHWTILGFDMETLDKPKYKVILPLWTAIVEKMAVSLFVFSIVFVLYALFGYPLLLLVWGRLAPSPIQRAPFTPTVSVLIAVRNGERYIADKLKSVFALNYPQDKLQVIVISDGSVDRTEEIVRQFPQVELLAVLAGGKCAALNAGIKKAVHEVIFFTDVRQLLDAACLANLCACLADPSVGVVSGELVLLSGDRHEHANLGFYLRFEEWLRKQISAVGSVAGATGAVYVIRRHLAVLLPHDILLDDVYQPVSAYFQGARVILDGKSIAYDYPNRLDTEFKRKVRTLAGIFQILYRFPALLNPRHGICIHFVSHKLSRLMLPYAFAAILAASFFLPQPWAMLALAGQSLFYGTAVLDFLLPEAFPGKRLTSLTRTFLTMLTAAVFATAIVFRPSQTLWKETR